ncbi:MAG TPA: lipocalin family protein [Bacteroidia bacterium]
MVVIISILGTAFLILIAWFSIIGRTTIPAKVKAVKPFYLDKYVGKWFEIARFDYYWEKDLKNVVAMYIKNTDGTVNVINMGYDSKKKKWKQSIGKAKFVADTNEGKLQVSFFGPFYSGYNVIAIDKDYQYALIAGRNLHYLWILSRKREIPGDIEEEYLKIAKNMGYDISRLTWTRHDQGE